MECIICNSSMQFFFSKHFDAFNLAKVDYWKCSSCGFVISRTHAELSASKWEELNTAYHSAYFGGNSNADDPRWTERLNVQAEVIQDQVSLGILPPGKWLDFASGDGKLSAILADRYGLTLLNHDPYMSMGANFLAKRQLDLHGFGFVITTSVFEHMVKREDFNRVAGLVAKDGIMGLHTMVCESVPAEPTWFYLLPVHCAFHTNESMSILMNQWGFKSSLYNVEARLWLFFRSTGEEIGAIATKANERAGRPKYIFKRGFVDYWK